MIRVCFKANHDDPRPVKWPVKHPFWITGCAGDGSYSTVVSYADNEQYILDNWPEAEITSTRPAENYVFTDRFPKPDWLKN